MLRSTLYQEAFVLEFQLKLTLFTFEESALRPEGAVALGHVVVALDTDDDAVPKEVV